MKWSYRRVEDSALLEGMKWPYHHVRDLVYRLKGENNTDDMVYSVCKDFEIERGLVSRALYNYAAEAAREHKLVKSMLEEGFNGMEIFLALASTEAEEFFNIKKERVNWELTKGR